jgi:hypothetical protein
MKKYLVLLCVLFSLLMVQAAAADNLVLNGGFEDVGNPLADPLPFTDWTVTKAPDPDSYINIFSNTQVTHSGNYAAGFAAYGSDDTISQTITTVANQTYTFSFWLYHPVNDRVNDFSAYWNGTAVLSLAPEPNIDNSINPYRQYSFTETGHGSDTIQFSGWEGSGYYFLDDVSVTSSSAAATPIPSSALLLGSGLLGLVCMGRRRRP